MRSEINVGLLSTAGNSVPVSPGVGDGSKVDRNGRRSGRPPSPPQGSKVLLQWGYCGRLTIFVGAFDTISASRHGHVTPAAVAVRLTLTAVNWLERWAFWRPQLVVAEQSVVRRQPTTTIANRRIVRQLPFPVWRRHDADDVTSVVPTSYSACFVFFIWNI